MKVYLDNLRLRFVPCYDIEGPVPVDTYDMQRYLSWREDFMMMSPLGSIGTLMIHGEGNLTIAFWVGLCHVRHNRGGMTHPIAYRGTYELLQPLGD